MIDLKYAPLSACETPQFFEFGFFFDFSSRSVPTSATFRFDPVCCTVDSIGAVSAFVGFVGFCAYGPAGSDTNLRLEMPEPLHLATLGSEQGRPTLLRLSWCLLNVFDIPCAGALRTASGCSLPSEANFLVF